MTDQFDPTEPDTLRRALGRAETIEKGNYFEAFTPGDVIEHRPGLVLSRHGSEQWASATLNHQPRFWRPDAARAAGHDAVPVHPDYLLACVMGPSVEALSEKGGYFLGRNDVTVHRVPPPGTAVHVESEVLSTRPSRSRPSYGIVTWETTGFDGAGDPLVSYQRTNMVPRRETAADGGNEDGGRSGDGVGDSNPSTADGERASPSVPDDLIAPDGPYFEDFRTALDRADDGNTAVAYRHERGRTVDDVLLSALPLATLNTARQHHNAVAMADSPSGELVAYGDVTRSIALAHARSDDRTRREIGYDDEQFHGFVTAGDTVYGFTRVLDADGDPAEGDSTAVGRVTFEHVAFNQEREPVYSGTRTALVGRAP